MKSKLEPVAAFAFHTFKETSGILDCAEIARVIRERDRQWERMLAELYREYRKESRRKP